MSRYIRRSWVRGSHELVWANQHESTGVIEKPEQSLIVNEVNEEVDEAVDEEDQCIICCLAKKVVINLPCKHCCACTPCFQKLFDVTLKQSQLLTCPLCRAKITSIEMRSSETS